MQQLDFRLGLKSTVADGAPVAWKAERSKVELVVNEGTDSLRIGSAFRTPGALFEAMPSWTRTRGNELRVRLQLDPILGEATR